MPNFLLYSIVLACEKIANEDDRHKSRKPKIGKLLCADYQRVMTRIFRLFGLLSNGSMEAVVRILKDYGENRHFK